MGLSMAETRFPIYRSSLMKRFSAAGMDGFGTAPIIGDELNRGVILQGIFRLNAVVSEFGGALKAVPRRVKEGGRR
jgi:hypothetical protein